MTRDEELYVESLRDDLKRAAEILAREVKHSGICPCHCCELGCPIAKEYGDEHDPACDVGGFLRRVATT